MNPPAVPITFVLDHPAVEGMRDLDPDRDWRLLQQGEEAWLLQTYLRLAAAGWPVELTSEPRDGGLVLFHAKQKRSLARRLSQMRTSVLVAIRGDLRGSLAGADFEIVQNHLQADGRRRFFAPHWPQPGLVPRDERRGDRLERLAYKGYSQNLHSAFRLPEWSRLLADQGVAWVDDSVPFAGEATNRSALRWPDFHDVDAVLAVRPEAPASRHKPPTKLYNAWLAGVPALLGRDPAFRQLRRGALDYLEVDSAATAAAAVARLRREPGLYRAMVENGRQRALAFTVPAILAEWQALLAVTIPNQARDLGGRPARRLRWLMETLGLR